MIVFLSLRTKTLSLFNKYIITLLLAVNCSAEQRIKIRLEAAHEVREMFFTNFDPHPLPFMRILWKSLVLSRRENHKRDFNK